MLMHTRFDEYTKSKEREAGQSSMSAFVSTRNLGEEKYSHGNTRQRAINSAIINDLSISCGLPIALAENPDFRHFLEVMDSRYSPMCR